MTASMISWGVNLQPVCLLSLTQQMIEHIQERKQVKCQMKRKTTENECRLGGWRVTVHVHW